MKYRNDFFILANFLIMIKISLFLLSRKGLSFYEYMDDWEKFDETASPQKKRFYRHLNIEDITDGDYLQAKRISKDFHIRVLGEYHQLCKGSQ